MNAIRKFCAITGRISQVLAVLSYIGYGVMIVITIVDIALRLTINKPIFGSSEIVGYALMITVFAAFAMTQTEHGHIQVTMFIRLFPARVRYIVLTVIQFATVAIWILFSYALYKQAESAYRQGLYSSTLRIPTYPFYWIDIICVAIFALVTLADAIRSFAAIFDKEAQEELDQEMM